MKLYYSNGSPFARRVRIVLLEKGIEFESDVKDIIRPIEEIRPLNPALQVPVFEDGDRRLFGSNLIIEYLYATHPDRVASAVVPPLAPSLVRQDRYWDDRLVFAAIETLADTFIVLRLMQGDDDAALPLLGRLRSRVESCLDWLEKQMEPEGFWPDTFSVMDINLLCALLYGDKRGLLNFRSARWPKIETTIDKWQHRPSVAATPVGNWPPKT